MNNDKFQRGAISVFLTIILVPCIIMTSLFVDLARVRYAKGVATSAGDLALNSLMSYFDADLVDFYGMVASCQTIEQFYEETEEYFYRALYAQGLEDEDIDSLLADLNRYMTDSNTYDLLDMEVQVTGSDEKLIGSVPGASLGESSVLIKDQIVEFMKYRAPVEIISGIVERLKKNDVAKQLEDAKKDDEIIKEKQEYADSEADLLKKAYKTYKYILKYQECKMTLDKLKQISKDLESYRTIYEEINNAMVSRFANTSHLTSAFKRPTLSLTKYNSTYPYTHSSVYSRKEKDDEGNWHYYIDGSDMNDIFNELESRIETFNKKKDNVVTSLGNTLLNTATGQNDNQANAIQWWVQAHNNINSGNNSPIAQFKNAGDSMLKYYSIMLAMKDCELGKNISPKWEETFNSLKDEVESLQKKYLVAGKTDNNDKYLKLVKKYEDISSGNLNNINSNNFKLSNGKTIGATVSEIKTKLNNYRSELNTCIGYLNTIIDGNLIEGVSSLDNLKTSVTTYNTEFNQWADKAKQYSDTNNGGTQVGESDHALITGTGDDKVVLVELKESDVTAFKTRATNIRTELKNVLKAIDSVTYCNKKICEIGDYNSLYNATKGKITNVPLMQGEVKSRASTLFSQLFKPASGTILTINTSDAKNPNIEVDEPTMWTWMKEQFKPDEKTTEDLDSAVEDEEGKVTGAENDSSTKETNAKEKDRTDTSMSKDNIAGKGSKYTASEFPSGLDGAQKFGLVKDGIGGIVTIVKDIVTGKATNSRDALYSTEYVMDMFSYSTYNNEGMYNLYKKTNGTAPNKVSDLDSVKDAWFVKDDITKTYNRSLTNKLIDGDHNVAFGAEAEYVLYGGTNKANVTDAYVDIFTIRYLLNTGSGFQHFWTGTNNATAGAIATVANLASSATCGIVPAPVVKVALILLLAVAETASDLDRLSDGFPVEFYKSNASDWRISLSGWTSSAPAEKDNADSGLFYSDYIYLFLFSGFNKPNTASEMYLRVGDLIQANMRKYTKDTTYTLKKSRMYFTFNATVKVSPLMLDIPLVQNVANNPAEKSEWCTFKLDDIRGYS